MHKNFGCVIMASGLGKRFGSNKLLADFQGRPLIQNIFDATEGLFAFRTVITRHETVASLCRTQNIDVVLHDLPFRNDTVRLGTERILNTSVILPTGILFCPADQPLLRRETICALLSSVADAPDCIIRPCFEGTPGAPVLFPSCLFPELLALPEGKGGGFLAKKYPEQVHMVPIQDPYELKDVDTPEDLTLLARHRLSSL